MKNRNQKKPVNGWKNIVTSYLSGWNGKTLKTRNNDKGKSNQNAGYGAVRAWTRR